MPRVSTQGKRVDVYRAKWDRLANAFVASYPFCVLCLVEGRCNDGASEHPARRQRSLVVDHITPHRGDSALLYDWDNLQTLCRTPCHDRVKQVHEKRGGTGEQWIGRLREVMRERGTREHVESMRQWIPSALYARLMVDTP